MGLVRDRFRGRAPLQMLIFGLNPTLTLVADSLRGSLWWTLDRMGPPAKGIPGSLTLQPNSPTVSTFTSMSREVAEHPLGEADAMDLDAAFLADPFAP